MRAVFSERSTGFSTEIVIGCLLVILGVTVTSGWLLHVPTMVEIRTGLVPMVFNTALCFLLTGIALLLMQRSGSRARLMRLGIAAVLLTLCSATLLEHFLDRGFGIDLPSFHTWYNYGNTRPGRMAPNTALGFMLIGATIMLAGQVASKRRALAVVFLTFGVLAIGLTGLVGYSLAPELLFGWSRSARMALHTASGMILSAIALWLTWSKSEWYLSRTYFREDEKIRLLGAAILIVVTVTVGLLGFVQLQTGLKDTLENNLDMIARSRTPWFRVTVNQIAHRSIRAAHLSGFEEAGRKLLSAAPSRDDDEHVSSAGTRLVGEGFRGIALRNADGGLLKTFGRINMRPEVLARLDENGRSELLWDGEIVLRTHAALVSHDGRTGEIMMDEAVPAIEKTLFDATNMGGTGELAACILQEESILCFPGNKHKEPFIAVQRRKPESPLPVEFAIAGKGGIIYSLDYRGKNVIAAYQPLAPGFGYVAKQDTTEVYAGVRKALAVGTPAILVVAVLGAMLLYSQLKPLASRMWTSELEALEKELEMRSIMDAAGDGILMIDQHGLIKSVNQATGRIFGYEHSELIGENVIALIPVTLRPAHMQDMAELAEGRTPRLVGMPNIELMGLKKDGTEFPIEMTISEVPLKGKRLFVSVMRDITERKAVEKKLSDMARYDILTGVPNRALFMERLGLAVLRTQRSGSAMALMFLDLDGFKQINDTLGHQAGDELLIQFAGRLSSMVRKTDTVARLAGDEFTVILEKLVHPEDDAKTIAEKIIGSMQHPFSVTGRDATVTASIGLAIYCPENGEIAVDELLQRADKEMYLAKHSGKNAVRMAVV